jgi:hypothetical protein
MGSVEWTSLRVCTACMTDAWLEASCGNEAPGANIFNISSTLEGGVCREAECWERERKLALERDL